jgi:hypothetical protein
MHGAPQGARRGRRKFVLVSRPTGRSYYEDEE